MPAAGLCLDSTAVMEVRGFGLSVSADLRSCQHVQENHTCKATFPISLRESHKSLLVPAVWHLAPSRPLLHEDQPYQVGTCKAPQ
ncbi:hypothetical protein GN956_G5824 [Arapaima gigas]